MFLTLPWLAVALLSLGPPDFAVGEMKVLRHGDDAHAFAETCKGILISRDTVLLRANCFERNLVDGKLDLRQLDTSFSIAAADGSSGIYVRTLSAVDLHPDFVPISCNTNDHRELCERAKRFCQQRTTGLPRTRCLVRPEPYARALLGGKNVNVALAYLNTSIPIDTTPLARRRGDAPIGDTDVQVQQLDNRVVEQQVLGATPSSLRLPFVDDMWSAPAGFVFVTGSDNKNGLLALPSHFAELIDDPSAALVFEYSRTDTSPMLTWIEQQMSDAVDNGKRHDSTGLRFVDVPAPQAPKPPDLPAPPAPSPAPQPEPQPEPDPMPLPLPAPPDTPEPAPQPDPSPRPYPVPVPREPPVEAPTEPTGRDHGMPVNMPVPRSQEAVTPGGGCGGNGLEEWSVILVVPALWRRRRQSTRPLDR